MPNRRVLVPLASLIAAYALIPTPSEPEPMTLDPSLIRQTVAAGELRAQDRAAEAAQIAQEALAAAAAADAAREAREAQEAAHAAWHVEQDAKKAREETAAAVPKTPRPATTGGLPAILVRIRGCESGTGPNSPGSYTAKNPRSTASGAWQALDSTWTSVTGLPPPARAYSPVVQDNFAIKLYNEQGTRPWNASKSCWG